MPKALSKSVHKGSQPLQVSGLLRNDHYKGQSEGEEEGLDRTGKADMLQWIKLARSSVNQWILGHQSSQQLLLRGSAACMLPWCRHKRQAGQKLVMHGELPRLADLIKREVAWVALNADGMAQAHICDIYVDMAGVRCQGRPVDDEHPGSTCKYVNLNSRACRQDMQLDWTLIELEHVELDHAAVLKRLKQAL